MARGNLLFRADKRCPLVVFVLRNLMNPWKQGEMMTIGLMLRDYVDWSLNGVNVE